VVKELKNKLNFFLVRIEIVYIFAAAKKYSEEVQRNFGKIFTS
tara:strand:- start:146 stop:274 length:129 start_codon:yes stop_codon:yes gene_type:complete